MHPIIDPISSASRISSAFVIGFAAFLLAACAPDKRPPAEASSQPVPRLTRAEFFTRVFAPAYEQFGTKNPVWDDEAIRVLGLLSAGAAARSDTNRTEIQGLLAKLENLRCTDPLVRYMTLRQGANSGAPMDASATNSWVEASLAFDATGYHPYWKFYSRFRAAQAAKAFSPGTNSPLVVAMRGDAATGLIELLGDRTLPTDVMFEAVNDFVFHEIARAEKLKRWTCEQIEPLVASGWGDTAEGCCLMGLVQIEHAWKERGSGWASSVTDEGWGGFARHLRAAREAFEKSWSIQPLEAAAIGMLTVELGDSRGRQEMEKWFSRAMQLNPASDEACRAKLYWLTPKWHGSEEEILAFGRECLTNRSGVGTVPLTFETIHEHLAIWHWQNLAGAKTEAEAAREYWVQEKVWADVKSGYERFFEIHPEAEGYRHNYARAAHRSEAWADLRAQLKLLGPVNHAYFGGREEFDRMVARAENER